MARNGDLEKMSFAELTKMQADIERMREYGFDDAAILKASEITGLYNLVNRMVSGLGVQLEDGLEQWEFGLQR